MSNFLISKVSKLLDYVNYGFSSPYKNAYLPITSETPGKEKNICI